MTGRPAEQISSTKFTTKAKQIIPIKDNKNDLFETMLPIFLNSLLKLP